MEKGIPARKHVLLAALVAAIALPAGSAVGTPPAQPTETQPPPVVVKVDPGGFDWQDAGLGAIGAFASVAVVFGLTLALRRHVPPASTDRELKEGSKK